MKTYAILTVSALIVASTMNSASALQKYCDGLPNNDFCNIKTGHIDGKTDTNTGFAKAFSGAEFKWSPEFCKKPYAGDPSLTNGAVWGDPCCKFKPGSEPEQKLTEPVDGTKKPKGTTCDGGGGGGGGSGGGGGAGGAGGGAGGAGGAGGGGGGDGGGGGGGDKGGKTDQGETKQDNTKGETPEAKEDNTKGETPEAKEDNTKGETPESLEATETNTKDPTGLSGGEASPTPAGGDAKTPSPDEGGKVDQSPIGGDAEAPPPPSEGGEKPPSSAGGDAKTPSPGSGGAPPAGRGCAAKSARKLRS